MSACGPGVLSRPIPVVDVAAPDASSHPIAVGDLAAPGVWSHPIAVVDVAAPRLIAPLSTATVTSRRPTLRWALASGTDGAYVQICRDRACNATVVSFDADGTSGSPPLDLPPGVLFWRARGRSAGPTGGAWSPTWQLTVRALSAEVDSSWGTIADVNGDGYADALVGAPFVDGLAGRLYVFLGGPSGLANTPATTLVAPDGPPGQFGSVASAGDVNGDGFGDVVVGAINAGNGAGRAYVYFGGPAGLASSPAATLLAPDGSGNYGWPLASVGDVDGDGYADIAVGAIVAFDGAGRVYIYRGGPSGPSALPAFTLAGPDGGQFGYYLANGSDVNGDGFPDLLIGACYALNTVGRVYLYLGTATGPSPLPAAVLTGPDGENGTFGQAMSASDINGDGYADLIIGAAGIDQKTGRVYVYPGSASGVSETPGTILIGPDGPNTDFGTMIGGGGDVNGDGYADLIVGGFNFAGDTGRAYVYLGSATGLSQAPAATLTGPDGEHAIFGFSAVVANDFDGDGYSDAFVGAPGFGAGIGPGAGYVYGGGATGVSTTPILTLIGDNENGGNFARWVAGAQ